MLPFAGVLPTTLTTLYRVPANLTANVTYIGLSNAGSVGAEVSVFVNMNGKAVKVLYVSTLGNGAIAAQTNTLILPPTATLSGQASEDNVTFYISGKEHAISGN